MSFYIQIGAGAGDLDHSADFRDGFSNFVKNLELGTKDSVLVVEANPFNIPILSRSWKGYGQVRVIQLAICDDLSLFGDFIDFFYSKDDGPFFQISSLRRSHVEKFYPNSEIMKVSVPCMDINSFLTSYVHGERIELLALDIEGMDLSVMQNLDLNQFSIHKISFERSHGEGLTKIVNSKLKDAGYRKAGMGMDPHNSDVLWVKPLTALEASFVFFSHLKHSLWEIQIPFRHLVKTKILGKSKFL